MTGTPGCGKTTAASQLPYRVIDLNSLVREGLNTGLDEERGCLIADKDALDQRISELDSDEIIVLEGHFSHHFAKEAIVLRLSPRELWLRLKSRGYSDEKIKENVEAEALDVILVEAFLLCDKVHEIDTTNKSPEEVAELIVKIIENDIDLPPGGISWIEEVDRIGDPCRNSEMTGREEMGWTRGD